MDVTGAIPTTVINSNDSWQSQLSHQLADLRSEQKETESELKTTALQATIEAGNNFRALDATMARNAAVAAKDSADAVFRLHDNIRNVTDAILTSSSLTQAAIASSNASTSAQFALVSVQAEKNKADILAALATNKYDALKDELDEMRDERNGYKASVNFGDKFANIQSQLNNLEQVQRSTNQAINFGTGAIGAQTTTSNQVR